MARRIFIVFPPETVDPLARPSTFTETVAPNTSWADVANAIGTLQPGESILLPAETTFTVSSALSIPEGVGVYGATDGSTVIQTAATTSDPTSVISVVSPNVRLQDLTIRQRKTSNSSIELAVSVSNGPGTFVDGFKMIGCRLESMEACLGIRASNYWVEGCEFLYVGPTGNTHRLIDMRSSSGVGLIRNNEFHPAPSGATQRFINLSSSTTADSYSGCLSLASNSQVGNGVFQFFLQDYFGGTPGGFELVFKDNSYTDLNGSIIAFSGGTANFADLYSHITLDGNSIANANKGLFAFDGASGTVAARSTALPMHLLNNALTSETIRAGWSSVHGGPLVVKNDSRISDALISVDDQVRPVQVPA
jgi:hypothetical protein